MHKDTTFKEKFAILNPWMPQIIETIKRDLKNEHLKRDIVFLKTYFPSKNPNKLTTEELSKAYLHAIANADNGENLGEFLTNRWLLKHGEIYHFFEQQLTQINPNFTELDEIDVPVAENVMHKAIDQFGAQNTYLFAIMNSVVFPREVYNQLRSKAEADVQSKEIQDARLQEKATDESLQKAHEREIARITDKYEKKLSGLQKKYLQDVEGLKKQISILQRKLNGK